MVIDCVHTCTKFAPNANFLQKKNPENLDGIGVFESCRKAIIISC